MTGYPAADRERELLERVAAGFDARALESAQIEPVATAAEVVQAQQAVRSIHIAADVIGYVQAIVAATRAHPRMALGASPRAGVSLLLAAQAAAGMDGRDYVTPDDVKDVAPFVLPHRMIVQPEAEIEGATSASILTDVLAAVPVPRA